LAFPDTGADVEAFHTTIGVPLLFVFTFNDDDDDEFDDHAHDVVFSLPVAGEEVAVGVAVHCVIFVPLTSIVTQLVTLFDCAEALPLPEGQLPFIDAEVHQVVESPLA
jgi:hypothetical protein